jgi:hypothetical protein
MKPRKQKKEEPERQDQQTSIDEQTEDIVRDDERVRTPGNEDIDDEHIDDEPLGRPVKLER